MKQDDLYGDNPMNFERSAFMLFEVDQKKKGVNEQKQLVRKWAMLSFGQK